MAGLGPGLSTSRASLLDKCTFRMSLLPFLPTFHSYILTFPHSQTLLMYLSKLDNKTYKEALYRSERITGPRYGLPIVDILVLLLADRLDPPRTLVLGDQSTKVGTRPRHGKQCKSITIRQKGIRNVVCTGQPNLGTW